MKHLKKFESLADIFFTQEDLDDIKDVFQDVMDEYSLLLSSSDNGKNYTSDISVEYIDLKFYCVTPKSTRYSIKIEETNFIRVLVITNTSNHNLIDDLKNVKKRLKLMGYKINESTWNFLYTFSISK